MNCLVPTIGGMRETPQPQRPLTPFVRPAELASALGVTVATLYNWIARKVLPKPKRIGPNAVGWLRSDIEAWMAERPDFDEQTETAA